MIDPDTGAPANRMIGVSLPALMLTFVSRTPSPKRSSPTARLVSARDFADETALAALGAEANTGSVRLLADGDLESGECRIDLQLGHVDIGAGTQWAQVAAFLDGLAEREAEA